MHLWKSEAWKSYCIDSYSFENRQGNRKGSKEIHSSILSCPMAPEWLMKYSAGQQATACTS